MTDLTPELLRAIREAGDEPVRLEDPDSHEYYVLIPADQYEQLRLLAESRERSAWLDRSEEAAKVWMRENPD
jgi:antibiotic biosynthesis monooxygenase (ABM) superfamily enzyme